MPGRPHILMSSSAQIQFAAEFVTFLVAAAGLVLALMNAELTTDSVRARVAFGLGFLCLAAAAFGHGSLLVHENSRHLIAGVRGIGVVFLGIGSLRWRGGEPARRFLWVGLGLIGIATAVETQASDVLFDVILAGGSVAIGVAIALASRRSIAARVAASAAATLLAVVLVLSVALSAVLSSSTQREEVNRLQARAGTEAALASTAFSESVQTARYAAAYLFRSVPNAVISLPTDRAGDAKTVSDVAAVTETLNEIVALYPLGGLAYLIPSGQVVAASGLNPAVATSLAGQDLVRQTQCPSPRDTGSTLVVGGQAIAAAAFPECFIGQPQWIGMVLRVSALDATYLDRRYLTDPNVSLALVTPERILAVRGDQPPDKELLPLGAKVFDANASASRVTANRYLVAQPVVSADRKTIAAFVVSRTTASVLATRDRLFRTLFLIALGGTLLALLLAAVVGERIGSGLRRLTTAAESVRRGEVGRRAGIRSEDEVGVLGAAFDSMVASIEEKTTALRSAAEDETRLRNRLEAVVAGMGDALVAIDVLGRVTDFNRAAEELSGIPAKAAYGKRIDHILRLMDEEGGSSLMKRAGTPSPQRWAALGSVVDLQGTSIPVAVSGGALRGPADELVGGVLVIRDRRRELQLEQMKRELLSRVGHELRTPLAGIQGYAEMLLHRPASPERAKVWQEEILAAAKRQLRIIEMLEFVSSWVAGRVPLQPQPVDVREVIDPLVARWESRLDPSHAISRRVGRGTPKIVADVRWLSLALDELVDNAVKFSPRGGKIMLSAAPQLVDSNGSKAVNGVQISVIDRGKGMTPSEQATAFSEFVQGDTSDTRQFGGLGLGLTLVQRVVEGHGGTISCESVPGRGTTLTITLPAADQAQVATDKPVGGPRPAGQKR
jgi:PAS domain S-box-containing protein